MLVGGRNPCLHLHHDPAHPLADHDTLPTHDDDDNDDDDSDDDDAEAQADGLCNCGASANPVVAAWLAIPRCRARCTRWAKSLRETDEFKADAAYLPGRDWVMSEKMDGQYMYWPGYGKQLYARGRGAGATPTPRNPTGVRRAPAQGHRAGGGTGPLQRRRDLVGGARGHASGRRCQRRRGPHAAGLRGPLRIR